MAWFSLKLYGTSPKKRGGSPRVWGCPWAKPGGKTCLGGRTACGHLLPRGLASRQRAVPRRHSPGGNQSVPVACGGVMGLLHTGEGEWHKPLLLEKPLTPLDSSAELGCKLAALLCSGNTLMGCPPQGSQGAFGDFGFPLWLTLSSVVWPLHSHCILLVKIVLCWLIFIMKPQRASRLSCPEGTDRYPRIRAGALRYNLNQVRDSFGFLNLDLTLGSLKRSWW